MLAFNFSKSIEGVWLQPGSLSGWRPAACKWQTIRPAAWAFSKLACTTNISSDTGLKSLNHLFFPYGRPLQSYMFAKCKRVVPQGVTSIFCPVFSSLLCFKDDMSELPRVKHTQLFINNKFVDSVSGKTFDTLNPSDESVIAKIAEADRSNITPVFS